jgi:hypothetical protein
MPQSISATASRGSGLHAIVYRPREPDDIGIVTDHGEGRTEHHGSLTIDKPLGLLLADQVPEETAGLNHLTPILNVREEILLVAWSSLRFEELCAKQSCVFQHVETFAK